MSGLEEFDGQRGAAWIQPRVQDRGGTGASAGDKPISQVARELGVRAKQIYRWRRQVEGRSGAPLSDVFPGNGKLSLEDEEIRRLRREVSQLREERDILKRATVDSMGQPNVSLSLLASVLYRKVLRGRSFSRSAIQLR